MDISIIFLLIFIGIFAGGYGSVVGAGGGFIFVPALLLILDFSPVIAAGTGLVIVLINALSSTLGYARQDKIDYKIGLFIALGAFPGSVVGILLLNVYTSRTFFIIFATILVSLGIFLFFKNFTTSSHRPNSLTYYEQKQKSLNKNLFFVIGFFMGVLSSYLGIGGGWLLVPLLIYVFKVPTHIATATSMFSLAIYSFYGVLIQMFANNIDWTTVFWGGIGIFIGSQIGVMVSNRLSGKFVIQMLSILLIVIGGRMFFN